MAEVRPGVGFIRCVRLVAWLEAGSDEPFASALFGVAHLGATGVRIRVVAMAITAGGGNASQARRHIAVTGDGGCDEKHSRGEGAKSGALAMAASCGGREAGQPAHGSYWEGWAKKPIDQQDAGGRITKVLEPG